MKLLPVLAASAALLCAECSPFQPEDFELSSPNGELTVHVSTADTLKWSVSHHGLIILEPSAIGMTFKDGYELGINPESGRVRRNSVERNVQAVLYRQAEFTESFNEIRIPLGRASSVVFRAYDEGCAYRFETGFKEDMIVVNETAEFNFADSPELLAALSDGLTNAFQFPYTACKADTLGTEKPVILPLAADCGEAGTVLICESDMESYPGMFLTPENGQLKAMFASVPDSCYLHERRCQEKVATRHDYIAEVKGERTYPWRIIAVADKDTDLPVNNLVYALGAENRIGDCSWIRPGKVAWDWWNDWGLTDVDFEPGIDNRTYKAYIDFAADYGLEYVVLDEGWSKPQEGDIMSCIAEINLPELVEYAASKNVGLILWAVANVLDEKSEEACRFYSEMGIKGFKVDFIDRDDQKAVDLVYRLAEVTAKHHLLLDIHGMYKPTGLNRTYPNIINFEGVYGLEELKWSNPDMPEYDVTFPYIRMVQGPVDYTPGAYRNMTREGFKIDYYNPNSQGTRAHQVATYVVFDSPLVMLCDSPSEYRADTECTAFIASLPVVCDETRILDGKIGEYIVTARRNGRDWVVGALSDWNSRELELPLSFLEEGLAYQAEILADAADADSKPTKYEISSLEVNSASVLKIKMAQGGGWTVKLTPITK